MSAITREALTAGSVPALVQKIIDPHLLEYQRRYSPLVRTIPSIKWDTDVFHFIRRDTFGQGGFVLDGGARPVSNGSYSQRYFQMKHLQTVGDVTGYAEKVATVAGSLRGREIEGSIQSLYWDLETALLWGNADATANGPYAQFSGLDTLLGNYSGAEKNAIDAAGATLSLGLLDQLMDMVETNAAMPVQDTGFMFVCSPTALSRVAQLLQSQQRFVGSVEVASGLHVMTYRDVPFVKSSFLNPRATAMGTVTTATATTGGTIAASASYRYQVSAVIARSGETVACTEVTQAAGAGTSTNTITLSFTPPTGLDGASPILYKVYRSTNGGGAGTATLLGVVDAVTGTRAAPVETTSIVDDGAALTPKNSSTAPETPLTAYVGTNAGQKPLASGSEHIYLINRDEQNLVRPYVRELEPKEVYPTTAAPDSNPYALVADCVLALRADKFIGGLRRVNTALA